jgi:hypothetical protein
MRLETEIATLGRAAGAAKRKRRIAECVFLGSVILLLLIQFVETGQSNRRGAEKARLEQVGAKRERDGTRDRLMEAQKALEENAMVFNQSPPFTLGIKPAPKPCP